ncbi:MAG TPA: RNA polymerase sigma factor [Candidatus Dormibacteraeota bacterium]|nr:RNA polymerase sigma factor [Candidatus Dormibacteraeota bacterium]
MAEPELVQQSQYPGPPTYQPGSLADFDRLYRDSYNKILATMVGVVGGDWALGEDITQDAFVRAFANWRRWRPEAPAEAWVLRIAVNRALSYRRKEKLRAVTELVRRLGRPKESSDPSEDLAAPLMAALRQLTVPEATVVVLRHYHGYSNREIAASLGIPESTVSSRLITAKRRLRRILATPGDEAVSWGDQGVISASPDDGHGE